MRRKICAIALILALGGCANGYQQFYTPAPTGTIPFAAAQATEPTVLASSGRADQDMLAMYTRGYGLVGYSSFNGPNKGVRGAIAQAKKVGATIVVVSAEYARTVSGVVPITTPTTSTTYSTGTVSAIGSSGQSAYGSYNGTATTYGTRTNYIPYSVDRYDQQAIYFAPLAREGLGIHVKLLTPEQAQSLGTNKAVMVDAVRTGSPAFLADVFPGDALKAINDLPVYDAPTFRAAVAQHGQLRLTLIRGGAERTITTTVPEGTW